MKGEYFLMAGYKKQEWTVYDESIPDIQQPNSFITKAKLNHIELGLEAAITDLQIGDINEGLEPKVEIITSKEDSTVKLLTFTFRHNANWLFSEKELLNTSTAPVGSVPGDIFLDAKGNVFKVVLIDTGEYRLNYMMNITGKTGMSGPAGPEGLPGKDGKDGEPGRNGTRIIWGNGNLVEGDLAPATAEIDDFVLDSEGDIFQVEEDMLLHKRLNIRGADGEDATNDFTLKIGEVTIGDTASAEIVNGNTLNLTIPRGETGAAGLPGTNGVDGKDGERGEPGEIGPSGKDGVGIENITADLDSDGKTIVFTFQLSDGNEKTAAVTLP